MLVVKLPTADIADGVVQWPGTRMFVAERLGPLAISVDEEQFAAFRDALKELGVNVVG